MPRFTGQNKKRVDPRYFMDEKLEESSDNPKWPEDKTEAAMMGRAAGLAQQGLSGEIPPWEKEDRCGDGFTDASLDESDFDVLKSILTHFEKSKFSGGGNRAEKFKEIMSKLGVNLESHESEK